MRTAATLLARLSQHQPVRASGVLGVIPQAYNDATQAGQASYGVHVMSGAGVGNTAFQAGRVANPTFARSAHSVASHAAASTGSAAMQWMAASVAAGAATAVMLNGYISSRKPQEAQAEAKKPSADASGTSSKTQNTTATESTPSNSSISAAGSKAGLTDKASVPDTSSGGKQYPIIRREEVEKHKSPETGIWVTYGEGVFDITEFVAAHPGGPERIMLAKGGPVEPFWAMYAQHKQPQVLQILEGMRIGTLPEEERITASSEDPYANDPERDAAIKVLSQAPFNGEAPIDALLSYITPTHLHYKRHHLPVPSVIPEAYTLRVSGVGVGGSEDGEVSLTMDDIRKFPKHDVTVTLQCAGNRRSEMAAVRGTRGLSWGGGAISTAVWSGARLRDVLQAQGVKLGPDAKHVEFVGLDADMEGQRYGASIPIEKALAEDADVLLAYEMNGEPLTRDHGYPLRAVVPGVVAARSTKWVEKIVVGPDESESHWQQKDYKGFCPDEDWDHLDWSKAPAIQETPVTSAILQPKQGDHVPAGAKSVQVKGYAYAGGGRPIIRVDVSIDGGRTWKAADLAPVPEEQQRYRRAWAWRHWQVDMPLGDAAQEGSSFEVVCKAVDDSYNVQPDSFGPIYNARGVLANAWNRLTVTVG